MPRPLKTPDYPAKPHASGQARIVLNGHDVYLGAWGSPESHSEYARVIHEWLGAGRQLLPRSTPDLSVAEVLLPYLRHAKQYYVKDGKPTKQVHRVKTAIACVTDLYGNEPATSFGPKMLKAVREKMIGLGWCRRYINQCVGCIQLAFQWVASEQLFPTAGQVWRDLLSVQHLHQGRSEAPESEPIVPVEPWVVEATLEHSPRILAAMVRLEQLTGMRPCEVCSIRRCEISLKPSEVLSLHGGLKVHAMEVDGVTVGLYVPRTHKTAHHKKSRIVALGPTALEILAPFLLRAGDQFLFSPREAEIERRAAQREARKSKVQPSQFDRSSLHPKKTAGEAYTSGSYAKAIASAIKRGNYARVKAAADAGRDPILIPHWFPLQLRHGVATKINEEFDLHYGAAVLGHARPDTTLIYTEQAIRKAVEVMAKAG